MNLDDARYTKVCYIQDISKLLYLIRGNKLSTEEFDLLYDSSVRQLHNILQSVETSVQVERLFNDFVHDWLDESK